MNQLLSPSRFETRMETTVPATQVDDAAGKPSF